MGQARFGWLAAVFLLAGCTGGGGTAEDRAAAKQIVELGGTVWYANSDVPVKTAKKVSEYERDYDRPVRKVAVQGKRLTGADLEVLKPLRNLTELSLQGCPMDDSAIELIASLSGLQKLDLYQVPVTDAALEKLLPLSRLTELELSYSRLTDKAVDTLMAFKSLKTLHILGTRISPDGLQRLKMGLPGCQIYR